jgi:hypothetical protein
LTTILDVSTFQSEPETAKPGACVAGVSSLRAFGSQSGRKLAVVLLTENARHSLMQRTKTPAMMPAALLMALVLMLDAMRIYRIVGDGGISIVSQATGLILASVATAATLVGIKDS